MPKIHKKLNPEDLFKIVRHEYTCMCGCTSDAITFLEDAISNNTITESDLFELGKHETLDWHRISQLSNIPLSIVTLLTHADDVDWLAISRNVLQPKTPEFLRAFHKYLNWNHVYPFITIEDPHILESLLFDEQVIPLQYAIKYHLLTRQHIQDHVTHFTNPDTNYIKHLLDSYTYTYLDSIEGLSQALTNNADAFAQWCIRNKQIPTNYITPLLQASNYYITEFIKVTKPDESFITNHILNLNQHKTPQTFKAISDLAQNLSHEFIQKYANYLHWPTLFQHKSFPEQTIRDHLSPTTAQNVSQYQRLTPEFIDEYADILDWYYLCEFQTLPEQLMIKHADKLNWGQVSAYQALSLAFINRYRHRLNEVKLSSNPHII